MKFLLTCSAGLEAIAKNEIIKQNGTICEVKDRLVFFEGDIDLMVKMNLWSRVGNKVYIVLDEAEHTQNFDDLYDLTFGVNWKKYINERSPILVKATSIKSGLSSTPAIQKIVKKAIVDKLTGKSGSYLIEDKDLPEYEVLAFFHEDRCFLLLNTSGETLYKRGYRTDSGEAPIKESLAAGLVLLSNWKFSQPLYDFTCGSGTIVIEALMLARNQAPWLQRRFAFEHWKFVPEDLLKKYKKEARELIFNKKYQIYASDIDENVLEIAKQNAQRAGLDGMIHFEVKNFKTYKSTPLSGTVISNPPYGLRLKDDDLKGMYKDIGYILERNKELSGGIITAYTEFDHCVNLNHYKKRKLYNGNELCYFYTKKA